MPDPDWFEGSQASFLPDPDWFEGSQAVFLPGTRAKFWSVWRFHILYTRNGFSLYYTFTVISLYIENLFIISFRRILFVSLNGHISYSSGIILRVYEFLSLVKTDFISYGHIVEYRWNRPFNIFPFFIYICTLRLFRRTNRPIPKMLSLILQKSRLFAVLYLGWRLHFS